MPDVSCSESWNAGRITGRVTATTLAEHTPHRRNTDRVSVGSHLAIGGSSAIFQSALWYFGFVLSSWPFGGARYGMGPSALRTAQDVTKLYLEYARSRIRSSHDVATLINAIDAEPATRRRALRLVEALGERGVTVTRVLPGVEGGIALYAAGQRSKSYASIDVDDDGDVVIGVSDATRSEILNSAVESSIVLDEVAAFLRD